MSGADALAQAKLDRLDELVVRVSLTVDESAVLRSCVEAGDVVALQEAMEFFQADLSDLDSLLDEPFKEKPTADGTPYWPSRFSNGQHPVYYASLEEETAAREYAHHAPKRFNSTMGRLELRLHLIQCRITGEAKDLRPLVSKYPGLIAESYDFCQQVGSEAKGLSLDALLSESVRQPQGTNTPAFERSALSDAVEIGRVVFDIDAAAQSATFRIESK